MKNMTCEDVIHVMDKSAPPAMTVKPGELFCVETAKPGIPDETFEKDYTKVPFPKRVLTITGPIAVEGAEPGDVLKINIHDIQLDTMGKMWMGQWMGILMDEVDHCYMRKVNVSDGIVHFSDELSFPVKPMIGTLGVAPAGDPIDCLYPGDHGGNTDALNAAPGSSVYLPVGVSGGMIAVGDVHAAMGYGEVLGTGIEIGSTVTLSAEIIKGRSLKHPVIETPSSFEVLSSGTDMMEICREATRAAIDFICAHSTASFDEAYAIAGQTSDLKILQVVNPWYTVSMEIPKSVLQNAKF